MIQWFQRECPQNYILAHPLSGSVILSLFCFFFLILYRPLATNPARFFSYEITMAMYCLLIGVSVFVLILILKQIPYFSPRADWSILKEIMAIALVLLGVGVAAFFAGFIIEESADRWNFATFSDSVKNGILIGMVPFLLFTAMNARYWIGEEQETLLSTRETRLSQVEKSEVPLRITSPLKKDELHFYPGEFIYAESDYNYVRFFLFRNNEVQKVVIRNTIASIEKQLAHIPCITRTHRAYLVNLAKVDAATGNSLGFRLKMSGIDAEIPVSRSYAKDFPAQYKRYR